MKSPQPMTTFKAKSECFKSGGIQHGNALACKYLEFEGRASIDSDEIVYCSLRIRYLYKQQWQDCIAVQAEDEAWIDDYPDGDEGDADTANEKQLLELHKHSEARDQ